MPSRVLLVNVNQCATPYPVYPLGLSHVASALERAGHTVLMLDMNRDRDTLEKRITGFDPAVAGLSLRNIDDVDIEKKRFFVPDLVSAVKRVRGATRAKIVIGGSAFSLFPERLLEMSEADYGVKGEGERALCELVAALESGSEVAGIPGLVHRVGGRAVLEQPVACVSSDIPRAAHPAELVQYYRDQSAMLNVQTQRGCAFRCCYCTYPLIEGARFRYRNPSDVVEEVLSIKQRGLGYFFVVDSVFNTSREHMKAVCEALIASKAGMKWCAFLRPAGLDRDMMSLMARAGLTHIEFGSDSFCDSVLEAYGKAFTFEDILASSELAREHNVHYAHFLIAGGPGETEKTLREGFENSRRLKKTVVFPFVGMRLYPGTPLYQTALEQGTVDPGMSLLEPYFYVAPGLGASRARELLAEFSVQAKNWVVGELPPEMARVAEALRRKGIEGPLWEYLAR